MKNDPDLAGDGVGQILSWDWDMYHLKEALIFAAFAYLFLSLFERALKKSPRLSAMPRAIGRFAVALLAVVFVRYLLLPL